MIKTLNLFKIVILSSILLYEIDTYNTIHTIQIVLMETDVCLFYGYGIFFSVYTTHFTHFDFFTVMVKEAANIL